MTKEEEYMIACMYAVRRIIDSGSSLYAYRINDGKVETVPWTEVIEWIGKKYGIEREVKDE